MKPYYDHAGVTIYHGDCREIVPTLPKVDLVLTDPPYGINQDGQKASTWGHGGRKAFAFLGWDKAPPDEDTIRIVINASTKSILWGGNYFHLPPSGSWLIWDKGQQLHQADCELAWTNLGIPVRRILLNRVELLKDGTQHPTQKPLKLMQWCLGFAPEAKTILDPFCGSGTTLLAVKNLGGGRTVVGIEREEKYCEIAATRLQQEVLPFVVEPLKQFEEPYLFK